MNSQLLELHYHLKDNAHAMNAHVRNKCEAEALAAFQHIAEQLGLDIVIETTAFKEGGLREIWEFITKPENAFSSGVAVLSLLAQVAIAIWTHNPSDKELDAINKELAKATLEERQLNIQKLKTELAKISDSEPKKPSPTPQASPQLIHLAVVVLQSDVKLIARRSNFYKALVSYDRVIGVGVSDLNQPAKAECLVKKADFPKFILKSDKVDSLIVETAVIEISAPVINDSGMHWKGIYQGEPISFAMKDEDFKNSVVRREVSFQNGNSILCVLKIDRKLDPLGDVVVTGRSVTAVIEKIEGTSRTETPKGRQIRFDKKNADSQTTLPFDNTQSGAHSSDHPDWGTF